MSGFVGRAFACALTIAAALAAPAAADPPAPVPTPAPAGLAMYLNGRGLSGPGADLLRGEIRNASVILYGEDHGFAGSPQILHALTPDAKAAGFGTYVAEISPSMAQTFAETWRAGGLQAFAHLVHDNPLAVPFLSLKEDAELAAEFVGPAGAESHLWGVDQEFIGSPTLLLQRLIEQAPSVRARTRVMLMLKAERAAQESGDLDQLLLLNAQPAAFDSLNTDFAGAPGAQDCIDAMRVSAAIYQLNSKGRIYASNLSRVRLMTQTFLSHYRKGPGSPPKVILRLGAYHTGAGTTPTDMLDLGTLLSMSAKLEGKTALRMLFLPAGGQRAAFLPTPGNPYVIQNYDDTETRAFLAGIGVSAEALTPGQWTLIPLAPVREMLEARGIDELPQFARFALLGFDYLITAPDAKPATPLY